MPVDIGKRIRETRLSKGYTQEDVANVLGITRQAVARWESNVSMPSTSNLMALPVSFKCLSLTFWASAGRGDGCRRFTPR